MNDSEIKDLIPTWMQHSKNHYLIVMDIEGKYRFVNDLFQTRFSYLSENFIGLPVDTAVHQDDIKNADKQ
ncbi:MAG: hypothetical protein IPQ05_17805 [Leptospiraceae bacterium]|nr:hypothetical protein [Leptospiraceae bacterium]